MKRPVIILLAGSAGLAAGFAVRWLQHGPLTAETTAQKSPVMEAVAKASVPDTSAAPRRRSLTPLAAQLEQQLNVSDGVSRWLEWLAVMEKAKLEDFPDLARLAKGNSVTLRMVSARWIELDRKHLFNAIISEARKSDPSSVALAFPLAELGQQLFEEWSKSDPAAAIAALSGPDVPGDLRDLRYTVLNSVMASDPENGLKVMAGWHIENYGAETKGMVKWAAANPRHAAEFALAHPAGYTTERAMEVIGKEWAKADPAAAMDFSAGLKDRFGSALATGVLRSWASADLGKAAAWLAEADPKVRNRLASPMLEVWAKTDTNSAMDWIQQNLTGSGMDEAVASVLKGAAEISVPNAAAIVSGMDSSQARAKAAVSVARKWWPEYSKIAPVPPEAVAWLSSLDGGSIKQVVEQTQWQWVNSDPKGFGEFLTTTAGQHAPEYAFTTAARELAEKNPQEALAWAAKVPEARRDAAAHAAFMSWQGYQAPAAMKWLRQLPPEDTRRQTCYNALVGHYVSDSAVAGSIAQSLAAGNIGAAQKALQALAIPDEKKTRLLNQLEMR